ncbi:peroxide stress protein YaaA [Bifidobacterium sp. ESL0763]|uniref:YaaA family protein n=1 Tax=Bifidobacterium sp. ESL0763 TaxID=2983227 RepID=UPI0023F87CB5|nr:peroxide stress protein YaaA [Bifidobacterium sp. ESL0763]MDF7663941.1 peroxide stress protein YaaA [Bifidobacterium sp. ESL0763]
MRLLLPPSEGKTAPKSGPSFDMDSLSFPELNDARAEVLAALLRVSRGEDAAKVLKVGKKGMAEVVAQRDFDQLPCAPAREVYTGVLYDAARLREGDDVLIFSGLFGVTSGEDPIPAYRLSMNVSLPGIGPLKTFWRQALAGWDPDDGQGGEASVELRSGLYRVTKPEPANGDEGPWWDVRITNSEGKTISHMAKHYRGLLARALLDARTDDVEQVACTLGTVSVEESTGVRLLTLVPNGL